MKTNAHTGQTNKAITSLWILALLLAAGLLLAGCEEEAKTGSTTGIRLDSLEFADANLAACVNSQPATFVHELKGLYCESAGITGLTGIEALTGLIALGLQENTISDVSPLASLTGLTYLDLLANTISDVSPLASLTGLTTLDLSKNAISDVSPLASLTGLTFLYLWANTISDISPLASLSSLTGLDLYKNAISDVSPLASLTKLRWLHLSANVITTGVANLVTLTSAEIVELSWNASIPCADLDTLEAALGTGIVIRPSSCVPGGGGGDDGSYITLSAGGGAPVTYTRKTANPPIDNGGSPIYYNPFVANDYFSASGNTMIRLIYIEESTGEIISFNLAFSGNSPGTYTLTPDTNTQGEVFYVDSSIDFRGYRSGIGEKHTMGSVTITKYDNSTNIVEGTFSLTASNEWGESLSLVGEFSTSRLPFPDDGSAPLPGAPKLTGQPTVSSSSVVSGEALNLSIPTDASNAWAFLISLDNRVLNHNQTISKNSGMFTSTIETSPATPSGKYRWQISLNPADKISTIYLQAWTISGLNFSGFEMDGVTNESYWYASDYKIPYITVTCPGVDYYFTTYASGSGAVYTVYDASETSLRNNSDWQENKNGTQMVSSSKLCLSPGTYLIEVWQGGTGNYSLLVSSSVPDFASDFPHSTLADNDPGDDLPPSQSGTPNVLILEQATTHTLGAGDNADWFKLTIP